MTRFRSHLAVGLLVAFGSFVGLAILEIGARLVAAREERRQGRLDRDLPQMKSPGAGSVVSLGRMIRRSENPRIVYELLPRLDVVFTGARVTTSEGSYRGPDVAVPKPKGVFRVVGIGDSYMFGQGVADDETYLSRLPGLLNQVLQERTVQTVNLAAPGFNTVMEVELLRARGPALEPDLVLIEIVGNDLDLPNFLWKTVDVWSPRRLFLLEFVRNRLSAPGAEGDVWGLGEAPREAESAADTFARDPDRVPAKYADMVGLPAFERAIRDLAQYGRERSIPVLALTHGVWFEREMLQVLGTNDLPVLVLRSALRQRARALGAPDYARSALASSPTDLHPSAAGHQAIAEELAVWLGPRLAR